VPTVINVSSKAFFTWLNENAWDNKCRFNASTLKQILRRVHWITLSYKKRSIISELKTSPGWVNKPTHIIQKQTVFFSSFFHSVLVAMAVPNIGPLVSLIGSIGFSTLGLMIPVLMETVWYWYPKDDDGDDGQACWDADRGEQATVAASREKKTTTTTASYRRVFRRAIRHVKNVFLFVLAVFAMIGGAYYNVRDIVALAKGDGALESPAKTWWRHSTRTQTDGGGNAGRLG